MMSGGFTDSTEAVSVIRASTTTQPSLKSDRKVADT